MSLAYNFTGKVALVTGASSGIGLAAAKAFRDAGAAVEYAPRGIRINAVCLGTIDTPMVTAMLEKQKDSMTEIMMQQPIGRLGHADEIASGVLWLCSPGASFVLGVALPVDGGFCAH